MRYKGFGRAILSTARNFISIDPLKDYEKLAKAGNPVLLIWGAEDTTIGKDEITKLRSLLNPRFLQIEKAGHLPHYESPEKVNPAIIQFLSL
jgi:pimeloyl-ACP methyl ester carboxylesterase